MTAHGTPGIASGTSHAGLLEDALGEDYVLPEPETRRGRATQQRILDAAAVEFGTVGFDGTSVAAIAGRADTSQANVYNYFPSKHAIFVSLVRSYFAQLRATLQDAKSTSNGGDRSTEEREYFEVYFRFMLERPYFYRVHTDARFYAPESFRDLHAAFTQSYIRSLPERYRETLTDAESESLALLVFGMASTFAYRWIVVDGTMPPPEALDSAQVFLRGGFRALLDARLNEAQAKGPKPRARRR